MLSKGVAPLCNAASARPGGWDSNSRVTLFIVMYPLFSRTAPHSKLAAMDKGMRNGK